MHACLLSHFSRVQLSVTLWALTRQAPLSMGLSRQEDWSKLPCPPLGDLPNPGIERVSPAYAALQVNSFNHQVTQFSLVQSLSPV